MAEYSKLAQGSFLCTAGYQIINLPFLPDYVYVQGISGLNHNAGSGSVNTLQWTSCMNQGDGILTVQDSSGNIHYNNVTLYDGGPGITTFSAGSLLIYGPQLQIASIPKSSNPTTVNTASNHGYVTGDIVIFEGLNGMNQICGIPFEITVTGAMSFTIPWNTNQSNYTAISGSPTGAYVKLVEYPYLYAPGVSYISSISLGSSTTVVTTAPNNFVVGQEVAFRIPPQWGSVQLNSLPNSIIPGSPIYGYVTSVTTSTNTFVVNLKSSNFTAFNTNVAYSTGLSFPQVVAVGDVNTGGWPYNGSQLYPSPVVNGANTINGPAIQGAFVNNTSMGFVIGSSILGPGAVNTSTYYWQAMSFDYLQYNSIGVAVE